MSRSLTRVGRGQQCEAWLHELFPAAYPVRVRFVKYLAPVPEDMPFMTKRDIELGICGDCTKGRKKFTIRISLRACYTISEVVECVIHEWAHAVAAKYAAMEIRRLSDHDDEYWIIYGRIYRAWHEREGWVNSGRYIV